MIKSLDATTRTNIVNKIINPGRKIFFVTILFGLVLLAYYIVRSSQEPAVQYPMNSSYQDFGDFEIDPETILVAIEQGNTDVFRSVAVKDVIPYTPFPTGFYAWSQSDYLKVSIALHQFVWREDLDNWHLYSMYFYSGCHDNPKGFDSGKMTYFKSSNGPFSYTTRLLDIYPVGYGVSWGGNANFPRPMRGWKNIDLSRMKLTAEDALQIAEEHGGREFRQKVNNTCSVDVFSNPNPNHDEDWIVYYDSNGLSSFEIHINPYTGAYIIKY